MAQPGVTTTGDGGFLDRFPLWAQLLAIVGVILLVWLAVHYLLISSMLDDASKKGAEAAKLRQENLQADVIKQNIADYQKTLEGLNAQLDGLKVRLPEEREITNIFENTKSLMERGGLTLVAFKTGDAKGKGATEVAKELYTEVPSSVTVVGKYSNIQSFFRTMAGYERIVNITDLTLKNADDKYQVSGATTQAQFNLTAFYISEQNRKNLEAQENPQAQEPADPKKKGKTPPKPAAKPPAPK